MSVGEGGYGLKEARRELVGAKGAESSAQDERGGVVAGDETGVEAEEEEEAYGEAVEEEEEEDAVAVGSSDMISSWSSVQHGLKHSRATQTSPRTDRANPSSPHPRLAVPPTQRPRTGCAPSAAAPR